MASRQITLDDDLTKGCPWAHSQQVSEMLGVRMPTTTPHHQQTDTTRGSLATRFWRVQG